MCGRSTAVACLAVKTLKNDLYLQTVSGNPALTALLQSHSVLLLQGPVGPFFDRLTHWLKGNGVPDEEKDYKRFDLLVHERFKDLDAEDLPIPKRMPARLINFDDR